MWHGTDWAEHVNVFTSRGACSTIRLPTSSPVRW
jgi:hypothetical protein